MRKAILLLIVCIASLSLSAQKSGTLYGIVKDTLGKPIEGVTISIEQDVSLFAISEANGSFSLDVPSEKRLVIVVNHLSFRASTAAIKVKADEDYELNFKLTQSSVIIDDVNIVVNKKEKRTEISTFTFEPTETAVNVSGSVEAQLTYSSLGVATIGGESSSAYSVRGGNFDENLVYVNDFEVYRPFLVRSGQQEGLSFANADMVKNLTFSSGGFQPKYGDKLSSVLDVQYRKPKEFGGKVSGSLLGAQAMLEGVSKDTSFTFLMGFRQKSSQYLLNSLQTKGVYSPFFMDFQSYLTYQPNDKIELQWITNYSQNRYEFIPVNRETDFGVVNQVLRFTVFFEGAERDRYQSFMSGLSLTNKVNKNLKLKWLASGYRTLENEEFDIIGEYFIGEVETDVSSENFDQVKFGLGTGLIQDWARNELEATVINGAHKGSYFTDNGRNALLWGADYKHEIIFDKLNEWERNDSAGYTIPFSSSDVITQGVLKSNFDLRSNRYSAYIQNTYQTGKYTKYSLTTGARVQYWDVNKEFLISPRVQAAIIPNVDADIVFTAAAGMYSQPPFYREMRNLQGNVNLDLKAQKSAHYVLGMDYNFEAWGRPFKFVTEAYYKQMWDLVPYELDNVLIRYFGDNLAKGHAYGLDLRLNGELVDGEESYLTMSVMNVREDIKDDFFYEYFDEDGEKLFGPSSNAVDSSIVYPGYIPRPTDQRINFALFFQDHLTRNENLKVHLNLVFGSGFPFGPADGKRHEDVFRISPYRRVDIGFSAVLLDNKKREVPKDNFFRHFDKIWVTAEVFNLFGINNTVSYIWIKDNRNVQYAVPNFLSARRFNAKLVVKF